VTPERFQSLIDPKRGYELGRVFLAELITREQHDAGIWAVGRYYSYLRGVLNSWPHPRNLVLEQLPEVAAVVEEGLSTREPISIEERARRTVAAYMLVEGAAHAAGSEARAEFHGVVYEDKPCRNADALKRALDSIRREAGL
jgi:hypothetical protein